MASSGILSFLGSGPARRTLFGPVDREQLQRDYQEALRKHLEEASQRWGFDFSSEQPLEGSDFQWEAVSGTDVPLLYGSCLDGRGKVEQQRVGAASPKTMGAASLKKMEAASPKTMGAASPMKMGAASPKTMGAASPKTMGAASPMKMGAASPMKMGAASPMKMGAASPKTMGAASLKKMGAASPKTMGAASPKKMGAASPMKMGAASPKKSEKENIPRSPGRCVVKFQENFPRSPGRCVGKFQDMEKTPKKVQNNALKRKQTNITDFYPAKRRLEGTPLKLNFDAGEPRRHENHDNKRWKTVL